VFCLRVQRHEQGRGKKRAKNKTLKTCLKSGDRKQRPGRGHTVGESAASRLNSKKRGKRKTKGLQGLE